ncbi:MAG: type II toxin-antitoxin system Phd/YefM family antitoxin [Candidatus Omnitrophota bacterium]
MSTVTISLTELRPKLPEILDELKKSFDRCVITRRGRPEAVVLSEEDYESLLETLDILSDKKLLREIKKAQDELRTGKGISWNKAKTKLGYV